MNYRRKKRNGQKRLAKKGLLLLLSIFIMGGLVLYGLFPVTLPSLAPKDEEEIKWVDFNVTYNALEASMNLDIESYDQEVHIGWVDTLSYLACKYGGDFSKYKAKDIASFAEKIRNGEELSNLTDGLKNFNYYQRAYGAVLNGFLGVHKVQVPVSEDGTVAWEEKYGLKVFSPIAADYWYSDYDDFGAGRSYGYDRRHLGHDLMAETGTPIIAVESGTVEAMGWNQYGGWRVGIRSFDGQRYYYYAHMRKDHPYNDKLQMGGAVQAGDVIGYSGRTGYSIKENVNNIDTPHLHLGMQLIFDEAEKDSPNQIWIDTYALTKLLLKNKSKVYQSQDSKEYYRSYLFSEPSYYQKQQLLDETEKLRRQNEIMLNLVVSEQPDKAAGGETFLGLGQEEGVPVPIIMYHGLIKSQKEKTTYFIDPSYFEEDLIYLKERGYTTIFMEDLIAYVQKGKPLPKKPVILSFDDGYYNNYYYAYPLLRQYDAKAVISIIGKFTDDFSLLHENHVMYSHITWDQMNEMINSGHVEIQNHTYNLHTYNKGREGARQKSSESIEAYQTFMDGDVGLLQKKIAEATSKTPTTFTYPFGFMSKNSDETLKKMGFQATLSCSEGINYITREPQDLFSMKRCLRGPGKSSEAFFEKIGVQ